MHYGKCVQSALKPALGAILTIMLAVGLAPAVAIAAESISGGGRLSVQVQVMSNQVEKVAHFMGVSKDEANLQLQHREQIYEVAVQQWDHPQAANGTNVCASIVPMRDNLDELPLLQTYSNLLSAGNLRSGQGNTQKVKPDGLRTLRHCLACTRQCILHRVLAAQVSRHRQHKLA